MRFVGEAIMFHRSSHFRLLVLPSKSSSLTATISPRHPYLNPSGRSFSGIRPHNGQSWQRSYRSGANCTLIRCCFGIVCFVSLWLNRLYRKLWFICEVCLTELTFLHLIRLLSQTPSPDDGICCYATCLRQQRLPLTSRARG